jgi:prepilin-type N-terminal cleavage/methylation domain-containing protein
MSKKPAKPRTAIRFSPFTNPPKMWQQHILLITTPKHQHPLPRPANSERGFSMIELCITLTIAGVLLATAAAGAKPFVAKYNAATNTARMAAIVSALDTYRTANGHYPCPAEPVHAAGTAARGTAGDCSDTSVALGNVAAGVSYKAGALYDHDGNPSTAPQPLRVREGAVPFRALGIPLEETADTYGRQFRYAVPELLAVDKATYDGSLDFSNLTLLDESDTEVGEVATQTRYVVLSHGKDGRGAYVHGSGVAYLPCIAGRKDSNNCGAETNPAAVYRVAQRAIPSDITAANFFDDLVTWQRPAAAASSSLTVSNQPYVDWSGTCPDGYDVAYTGRQMVLGLVVAARRPTSSGGVSETISPSSTDLCIHENGFKAKRRSAGLGWDYDLHPDGTFSAIANSGAVWGSVKGGSVCAVCVGSAL